MLMLTFREAYQCLQQCHVALRLCTLVLSLSQRADAVGVKKNKTSNTNFMAELRQSLREELGVGNPSATHPLCEALLTETDMHNIIHLCNCMLKFSLVRNGFMT